VAALAVALALAAFVLRTGSAARDDAPTRLERLLATHERTAGDVAAVASLVVGSYAVLAAILQVAQWLSGTRSSFEWGHAAATGFLAATAVALLVLGSRRVGPPRLWLVGLAWLGVTLLELTWADSHLLGPAQLELAQSLVGGILLAGGYVAARVGLNEARYAVYGLVPVSAVLAAHVAATSVDGDSRGYLFALLAAVYGALTAASFVGPRDRNLIALLTAPATLFAAAAAVTLVESWWLAPALAALAASLLLLARAVREPRFQLYGLGLGAGVAGVAAWFAPPTHLLRAVEHPAAGIGAVATIVVLLALAAATVAGDADGDALDRRYAELAPALARRLWWGAAGAALYGVSLLVLELFHRLGGGSLHTGFQRGETAVSGLWALVGLGLLCLGLFRRRRPVRIGGLVLLAVALVKLFAFDLSNLSSLSRAVSFLVVGAALLGGGFVYQRLNAELGGGANTA
jgi:uncharacterized membrane protein